MAGKDSINALNDAAFEVEQVKIIRFIIQFILDLTFSLVMPFLRRNFGERFFSLSMILFMGAAVTAVTFWLGKNNSFVYGYMAAVAVLSLYHLLVIFLRNRKGVVWHSRHEGDFLPFLHYLPKASYWMIEGFYEPLIIVITGAVVSYYTDPAMASFFWFIAAAMVLRSRYAYRLHKEKMLDERDAQIEAENKMQALEGAATKDTKGFVIKGANSFTKEEKSLMGKKILNKDQYEELFPEAAEIKMSKDDMRGTATAVTD